MAEGTPASLIREHSSREVLEVRFGSDRNEQVAPQLQGIGERVEVLPDRILIYTDNGERALERITRAGSSRSPAWCAARASRMCSCA